MLSGAMRFAYCALRAAARTRNPDYAGAPSGLRLLRLRVGEPGADHMLHLEWQGDRTILVMTPDGPLSTSDFERLAQEVDPVIASKGPIAGLLICVKSFPGW